MLLLLFTVGAECSRKHDKQPLGVSTVCALRLPVNKPLGVAFCRETAWFVQTEQKNARRKVMLSCIYARIFRIDPHRGDKHKQSNTETDRPTHTHTHTATPSVRLCLQDSRPSPVLATWGPSPSLSVRQDLAAPGPTG